MFADSAKRIARVALATFLLLLPALATDFASLQPQGYVSDFANVVDPGSKKDLEAYCAAVQKATGVQMALVTVPTLQGEPIEEVANALFRKWGVGKKGANDGLLFLLAVDDHRSRLEVGYGLEPTIPDGFAGMVLDAMRPALKKSQYGEALKTAADQIAQRIAKAKGVTIQQPLPGLFPTTAPAAQPETDWGFWGLLVLMVVVFLLFRSGGRGGGSFLPGIILGNVLGSGGRNWGGSGGGFGGYDSGSGGGGFGGFGGGDSGGGGASSSW